MTDPRIELLDTAVADLTKRLEQYEPHEWENLKVIRDERDVLRVRVANLEELCDQLVDAMTQTELRTTPSSTKRPGRPRGVRDSKPRKRKTR